MDKNMINIDDLVRQRLAGAEEREPAGAWLRMKDLLDEQESKRRGLILPWKGALTALLLIGALSVGGYWMSQQWAAAPAQNELANEGSISTMEPVASTTPNPKKTSTTQDAITANTPNAIADTKQGTAQSASSIQAISAPTKSMVASNTSRHHQSTKIAFNKNVPSAPSSIQPNPLANPVTEGNKKRQNENKIIAQAKPSKAATEAASHVNDLASLTPQPPENLEVLLANSSPTKSNAAKAELLRTRAEKQSLQLVRDTITRILAREYFVLDPIEKRKVRKLDTVAIERVPREQWVAMVKESATLEEGMTVKKSTTKRTAQNVANNRTVAEKNRTRNASVATPAASPNHYTATTTQMDETDPLIAGDHHLMPLAEKKVSSKKYYESGHQDNMRQMMNRVKNAISQIHFYPGIIAGANTRFTSQGMISGFQAGFTGLFAFYKKWSLMIELKYLQNFNNGQQIYDSYISKASVDSGFYSLNGQNHKYYELRKDSVDRGYKFSMMEHLALPITLRYALGRFDVLAGLNLNYYLPIKAEDASKNYTLVRRDSSSATQPFVAVKDVPTITLADFGSRFGVGYVFGASYQFTPAVNMDLRLSKMFWDNAQTAGEKRISHQLFKAPTLQLSIGYRFGQGKATRR